MPDCIDLWKTYRKKYRVGWDESQIAPSTDPWLSQVLCRHGHIYPQGGDLLAVSTNRRGHFLRKFVELGCMTVLNDGDDGINASFHIKDFDKVTKIMKPIRRRSLSPEQRAAASERLAQYRRTNP